MRRKQLARRWKAGQRGSLWEAGQRGSRRAGACGEQRRLGAEDCRVGRHLLTAEGVEERRGGGERRGGDGRGREGRGGWGEGRGGLRRAEEGRGQARGEEGAGVAHTSHRNAASLPDESLTGLRGQGCGQRWRRRCGGRGRRRRRRRGRRMEQRLQGDAGEALSGTKLVGAMRMPLATAGSALSRRTSPLTPDSLRARSPSLALPSPLTESRRS